MIPWYHFMLLCCHKRKVLWYMSLMNAVGSGRTVSEKQPDPMYVVHQKKPGCRLVCKQSDFECQSTVQMVRQGLKQLPAGQAGNATR